MHYSSPINDSTSSLHLLTLKLALVSKYIYNMQSMYSNVNYLQMKKWCDCSQYEESKDWIVLWVLATQFSDDQAEQL